MPTSPVFKSNQQAKPKLLSSVSVKPQPKPATIAPANTISDTAKQNQLAFDLIVTGKQKTIASVWLVDLI